MFWLQELKWPEVQNYLQKKDLILLPIGSTEQHGRHAPLGTDSFIAEYLARDAAEITSVLCAPPLYYGWSPQHLILPGTISIDASVLERFLFCEIRSLSKHGFKNFIVINGHRITNLPWMQIGAEMAQSELGVNVVIFDPAYMLKEELRELEMGYIAHSEQFETSQMLYLRPDLIDLTQAVDLPESEASMSEADPAYYGDSLVYVPNTISKMERFATLTGGNSGQPTKSTPELGERLHKHLVKRLVQVIELMNRDELS
jgi:creatinine amidohydrolase